MASSNSSSGGSSTTDPTTTGTTDSNSGGTDDNNSGGTDDNNSGGVGEPRQPTAEELAAAEQPTAPAAIDGTAVDTVTTIEGEKKVGWQQEPAKPELLKEPCFHTAIVQARKQVPAFEVGHEWVCICGTIFVVHINRGGKKTLVEKEALVEEPEEIPAGLNVG